MRSAPDFRYVTDRSAGKRGVSRPISNSQTGTLEVNNGPLETELCLCLRRCTLLKVLNMTFLLISNIRIRILCQNLSKRRGGARSATPRLVKNVSHLHSHVWFQKTALIHQKIYSNVTVQGPATPSK